MKIDAALSPDWLAARLHSPDTPHDALPVRGFRQQRRNWRPRPAAVLLPIVHEPEPAIVLTVRSRKLSLHAGQVAFPGGGREPSDAFPLGTALRETSEEIGIDSGQLCVHGLLDRFDTITGYRIVPVVASIEGSPRLRACPREVEQIFTLPLATALDPESYRQHLVMRGDYSHELYTMSAHHRWMIWGATAAILHQFCTRLKEDS